MGNAKNFKVKAVREGFHGEGIQKEDAIFFLTNAREFSVNWMKDLTKDGNLAELAVKDKAEYLGERNPVVPVGVTPERKEELEAEVRAELRKELQTELENKIRAEILAEIADAETADGDDDKAKVTEDKALIELALGELDHADDSQWIDSGLPNVDSVAKILGNSDIKLTRKLLNEIAPDLVRKEVV